MEDKCNYLDYIVNVVPELSDGTPLSNWRNITYKQIDMELIRNCGGVDEFFVTEDNRYYESYWEFSVPIKINLFKTKTQESMDFLINPTTIVTSRLPIMFKLTNTFVNTINGEPGDIFANKLAVFLGLTGTAYTEARALIMWSQGPNKIKNIVDNDWLMFLTNSGLILEEFMVFNSVDAMSLIELAKNVSDFTGDNKEGLESNLCNAVKFDLGEIEQDINSKIAEELGSGYDESDVADLIEEAESRLTDNNMIKSVQQIAENILYEVESKYYYYRVDSNNEPVDEFYNPCDRIDAYTVLLTEAQHKDKGISYEDPANSAYSFVLGNPDASGNDEAVKRYLHKHIINQTLKDQVESKLEENYKGYVSTDVVRTDYNNLGYSVGWTPDYAHGDELESTGSFIFDHAIPIGSTLDSSDIIPVGTYIEKWRVLFRRTDTFKICTDWDPVNHTCNSSTNENHDFLQDHIVEFKIKPNYDNNSVVDNVFSEKNDLFNLEKPHINATRNDDNLKVIRRDFPDYFVNNIRDIILESYSDTSVLDTEYYYSDGNDYKVDWVRAKDGYSDQGNVVEALEEILSMIKSDEDKYSNASKEYSGDSTTLDTMDSGRMAMLQTFIDNRDNYEKEYIYHKNNDISEKFKSIGSKTTYDMRKWYLYKIQEKLEDDNTDSFKEHIKENIGGNGDKFDSYEELQGPDGDDYKNALGDLDSIGNGQGIQIGLAMNLKHHASSTYDGWSEDIAFALDREPNYFDFDSSSTEWDFNIKNTCWGGPTGIPLLPIPPIPWFCTVNFWTINVDGSYKKFKIVDTLDETHADPLFGHDGQIFIREGKCNIRDNCTGGEILGDNTKLSFEFWVPSFAIVPPNKLPIGDIEGGLVEEN